MSGSPSRGYVAALIGLTSFLLVATVLALHSLGNTSTRRHTIGSPLEVVNWWFQAANAHDMSLVLQYENANGSATGATWADLSSIDWRDVNCTQFSESTSEAYVGCNYVDVANGDKLSTFYFNLSRGQRNSWYISNYG